jgi:hypothetical protein
VRFTAANNHATATTLSFSGADLWTYGALVHVGLMWSLGRLDLAIFPSFDTAVFLARSMERASRFRALFIHVLSLY